MNGNNLTLRVKELARQIEMDYAGVAPVERLRNAPDGWRPADILSGARSVVVIGIRIGQGVLYVQKRANEEPRAPAKYGVYVYQSYGYNLLNDKLNLAAWEVAKVLEAEGYITVPIPASPPYDVRERVGIFSHRHAAVAAGLGEFGWNNLLLIPNNGPRVRLVSVITTAELEPDPMYEGAQLCDPATCGRICVRVCPTLVLSQNKAVKFDIGGKVFQYSEIDRQYCLSAPCGRCLLYCPVGETTSQ